MEESKWRDKLSAVLGDQAVVTKYVIKEELRLSGLDDSVTIVEIIEVIFKVGGYSLGSNQNGTFETTEQ